MVLVPPEACLVTTPLKAPEWFIYLQTHPDQELVQFFLKGIKQGFRKGFNYHSQQLNPSRKIWKKPCPIRTHRIIYVQRSTWDN